MKYGKFNRIEKKQIQAAKIKKAMGGEGLFLYENNSDASLTLPKPTKSGIRTVGGRKQFQGDSYYKQMVPAYLRLIKTLQSPEQERALMEEKLILDQPDTVTPQGTIEHVTEEKPVKKLNEAEGEEATDVLLNEGPCDDGFVIVGD